MVYLSALPNNDKSDKNKSDPEKSNQSFAVTASTGISSKETSFLKKYYKESKNDKYKAAKNKITQKTLNHIKQVYPDCHDAIEVVDTYSPMTFQRYTMTKNGSAYGIKKTARHFLEGMFHPATKVRNLFLTGQSIGFNGIHGSIVSSVNLCQVLLGKEYLTDKIVTKR